MRSRSFLLPSLLLAVLSAPLLASPANYKKWHDECLAGGTAEIDRVITRFEEVLKRDRNDHLARVYLGSACTLRSKKSRWGPSKMKFLKRGGELMDQAVAAAPKESRVRFVRAVNAYSVPKKFKRRPVAVSDFTILMPVAERGDGELSLSERQAILYYASLTFAEEGHAARAARCKRACHLLAPGSEYGKRTAP